jgi:DNA repair photolyase
MKVSEIQCKSALSPSGIYGWVYALNPYRGCEHGCKYCYAPNILRYPRTAWGTAVEVKKNIPVVLAKELKNRKPALVGISSVTDPYQPVEKKYEVTRYCLEQLLKYNFPVSIITKSSLVLRDIDLLKRFEHAEITITITTLDEHQAHTMEPHAPTIKERMDALTKLSNEGLNTYAFLGPLLPTLEPHDVPELFRRLSATGVRTVMVDTLNLKPGIRPAVEAALDSTPIMKSITEKFQKRAFNASDYYQNIFNRIQMECDKHGIMFDS